ncbi:glutathione synthetase-like [Xenia sp. Carnegie-2017]|uniref:glutathione synthetase-like n=1 Tax=Xenia sp. Carnegie-2017 TaxID=2897299 RepID=UPI001F048513|nr:glutathione synthetase-like [Xenia sp. Carnegie-2017]
MDMIHQGRNIPPKILKSLVEEAQDYAVTNGILMIPSNSTQANVFSHAPFTLFASPFPEKLFLQGLDVQKDFNLLVDCMSKDFKFLKSRLEDTISADEFTKKLFNILETVVREGITQKISLGLFRSDYMMNPMSQNTNGHFQDEYEIKQIEINTISCSFSGLGPQMTDLHRYVEKSYKGNLDSDNKKLPTNDATKGFAQGIALAWELYEKKSAVILMVVQKGEKNRADQRLLEYTIKKCNPAIKMIRCTLEEIEMNGTLKSDKTLFMEEKEIAVVYFRAGYTPNDYHSETEWSARLKIERSYAIKCPTIAYQLIGLKKIQQVLAEPKVLERFLHQPERVKKIRKTFAGLYTLDNGEEGDKNVKMALENPERFVVKPQREGGGNNIYGEKILEVLSKNDGSRTQYVLMEKVRPPVLKNYIIQVHKEEFLEEDVLCELGVFGVVISNEKEILENKTVGHLLRTKAVKHDDGGVVSLRAVLDSPRLV